MLRRTFSTPLPTAMTDAALEDPPSPCIGVCQMHPETLLCEGCYRTAEEIEHWWDYTPQEKHAVLAVTQERLDKIIDGTYFD
ncbi:hypothetical protein EV699_111151 [Plasticicumulans lactativorans]|uniref:Fe-S protein YdhL (DUF1289 family) n=1 Tax=Plasticicumulans lactativorans TaxID=1133106 RepID=A0A4V2SCV9_9GAMM|nr:DUF1289 domain-containing protein [Plasticicumulans lactativorans]TCO80950.1 hypothetical protein EV699_111151 [Plasticicumulans lactativorans]